MTTFNENSLRKELKIDARALGIPAGAAESFINETIKSTLKTLKGKSIITNNDLKRIVYKELKKYHADLAYVYKNRDKII
ncbi:hypothetical protein IKE13_03080 [Candidatus Saccharibacteria bacterium]|nr:hypothetical protein [Candidatus Saccharibacteria bacterium]